MLLNYYPRYLATYSSKSELTEDKVHFTKLYSRVSLFGCDGWQWSHMHGLFHTEKFLHFTKYFINCRLSIDLIVKVHIATFDCQVFFTMTYLPHFIILLIMGYHWYCVFMECLESFMYCFLIIIRAATGKTSLF